MNTTYKNRLKIENRIRELEVVRTTYAMILKGALQDRTAMSDIERDAKIKHAEREYRKARAALARAITDQQVWLYFSLYA
jgi:hypothetical protein